MWLRWLPQFGNTNLETGKLNKNFLHSLMSYNFQQHLHTSEIIYVSTKKKLPLYVTRRQKKKKEYCLPLYFHSKLYFCPNSMKR